MNIFTKSLQALTLVSLFSMPYAIAQEDSDQDIKNRPNNQQADSRGRRMKGGKPPQEAISSCSEQATDSACSFQGRNGLMNGTCQHTPDEQYFACKPIRKRDER